MLVMYKLELFEVFQVEIAFEPNGPQKYFHWWHW